MYDEVRRAIGLMEQNHEKAAYSVVGIVANPEADPEIAQQVCELLRDVDERLDAWVRKSWRWRLLMIRAELDVLRYTCAREQADTLVDHKRSWTSVMEGCDQAKPLLTELCQILHANLDYDNETHPHYHCVRPQIMDV